MSGIGGAIIGGAGVGDLGGGGIIGGAGVEGAPDGGGGATPGEFDFSAGLPAGFSTLINTGTALSFVESGGFTEIEAYTYPGNAQGAGAYNDDDIYGGGDVDVRLTFAWDALADTSQEVMGPAIYDPTTNALTTPALIDICNDRNFNRILPGRFSTNTNPSHTILANGSSTHGLSGGELTADGSTLHTIGFAIRGNDFYPFFDNVQQITTFALDAAEQAIRDGCTRVGFFWQPASVAGGLTRILTLELKSAGSIYSV